MKQKGDAGTKWPWIILASILGVVGLSYWTVNMAIQNPVQMSDLNMQEYHDYDHEANDFIKSKAAFDQKYDLHYLTESFTEKAAVVKFRLTDKDGTGIDSAEMTLRLTRPNTHDFDVDVPIDSVRDGVYTFKETVLPKAGRWDILLHVVNGPDERYMNLKADTRYSNVFEY